MESGGRSESAPRWAQEMDRVNSYLLHDLLGGPKQIKLAWVINLHKALTPFVVVALMLEYENFATAPWVYLAIHGTYAYCWLLKHFAFGDRRWETMITLGSAAAVFLMLALYWVAPFLLISSMAGPEHLEPAAWLLAFCIALFGGGMVIMIASDCQKHFELKYGSGLITGGMFKYVRYPNYLGEMMIYASFAILAGHWIPWVILALVWSSIFLTNVMMVDASISRYPEWKEYKSRTSLFLPWKLLLGSR